MRSFPGGIHLDDHSALTRHKEFVALSVPHFCTVPLSQHVGNPARSVVKPGETVREGQLIASADGMLSAPVHAPISGIVIAPKEALPGAITIEARGAFGRFSNTDVKADWNALRKDEIVNKIRASGIVGLGGGAFPTAAKLSPPGDISIDTLIVNGAESDPYLTADDQLMRSFPAEIIDGIRITLKALSIGRACIGIGNKKKEALSAMRAGLDKSRDREKIEIIPISEKYPQGSERQLVRQILKRTVPADGRPHDCGVVVLNVGTINAIREAIRYDKPLFERYMTITGAIIKNPGNYRVRIGTSISDIIAECGGLTEEPGRIIMGGIMRGTAVTDLNAVVVKATTGIIFLSKKQAHQHRPQSCIRCGRCVAVCPSRIMPYAINRLVEQQRLENMTGMNPGACIRCGACSFICPARLPLSCRVAFAADNIPAIGS